MDSEASEQALEAMLKPEFPAEFQAYVQKIKDNKDTIRKQLQQEAAELQAKQKELAFRAKMAGIVIVLD